MKKYIILLLLLIGYSSLAQNPPSNSLLVRHDTTLLNASECQWIIRSLVKNDPLLTAEIGKPVTEVILQAIEKGKLKAIDPVTNLPIPGKQIFNWQMAEDTMMEYDEKGEAARYVVVKKIRSVENISRIRVYQDWYFDISSGKIRSEIKWIELLEEIHSPNSEKFIGYSPLFRIYY